MIDLRSDTQTKPSQAMRRGDGERRGRRRTGARGPDRARARAPRRGSCSARRRRSTCRRRRWATRSRSRSSASAARSSSSRSARTSWSPSSAALPSTRDCRRGGCPASAGGLDPGAAASGELERRRLLAARGPSVLAIENTHNTAGGTVWPLDELREVVAAAPRARAAAAPRRRAAHERGGCLRRSSAEIGAQLRHGDALPLEGARVPARRADRGLAGADAARPRGEAPLRRCDAPGRHRRRGRALRARPQRRAARRRPRARAPARRRAGPHAGLPVDLELVETNFVQLDVASLGLDEAEAIERLGEHGVALARREARHTPRRDPPRSLRRRHRRARSSSSRARSEPMSTPDALDRLLQERQADRLPSVAAAVVRKGELAWSDAVGSANYDEEREATPGDAVPHRLDHEDVHRDRDHAAPRRRRARPRRPARAARRRARRTARRRSGACWRTSRGCSARPGRCSSRERRRVEELIVDGREFALGAGTGAPLLESRLRAARRGRRATKSGMPYTEYVDERIIGPLGLSPHDVAAAGAERAGLSRRRVRAHRVARAGDRPRRRGRDGAALVDRRRSGDAGRRSSRGGDDGVLDAETIEEMWFPQVMSDRTTGCSAGASGSMLYNQNGQDLRRPRRGDGRSPRGRLRAPQDADRRGRPHQLRARAGTWSCSRSRSSRRRWSSGPSRSSRGGQRPSPPDDVRALLGRWWSEGNEFVFWWERGALQAKVVGTPPGRGETTFERDGDGWRAAVGRERGERLRVEERPAGLGRLPVHARPAARSVPRRSSRRRRRRRTRRRAGTPPSASTCRPS